jgi:hypothetical protein
MFRSKQFFFQKIVIIRSKQLLGAKYIFSVNMTFSDFKYKQKIFFSGALNN